MNFQEWYAEADMPEMVDGKWVDLETGIPFSESSAPRRTVRKPVVLEINGKPAKVAEGLAYVVRLAKNQEAAMARAEARNAASESLGAYRMAAQAAISTARALTEKSKKMEIAIAIKLNQAASRAANRL